MTTDNVPNRGALLKLKKDDGKTESKAKLKTSKTSRSSVRTKKTFEVKLLIIQTVSARFAKRV